jgi:superfamily II DNA or RNA helicase
MSLASRLSANFEPSVRSRGQNYYWGGQVRIRRGSPTELTARVDGERTYNVAIEYSGGWLDVDCDCPYFEGQGLCKHLWAAILAADDFGYLRSAARAERLKIGNGEAGPETESGVEPDPPRPRLVPQRPPAPPEWKKRLAEVGLDRYGSRRERAVWPAGRQILYVIDTSSSQSSGNPVISLWSRAPKQNGDWSVPSELKLTRSQVEHLPDPVDRDILTRIDSVKHYSYTYSDSDEGFAESIVLRHNAAEHILRAAAASGRLFLNKGAHASAMEPLVWDEGGAWTFQLEFQRPEPNRWVLDGIVIRGEERMRVREADVVTRHFLVAHSRIAALAAADTFDWLRALRKSGSISATDSEARELLDSVLNSPALPPITVPEEFRFEEINAEPKPHLRIESKAGRSAAALFGSLTFEYGGQTVTAGDARAGIYHHPNRQLIRRDLRAENAAAAALGGLGLKYIAPDYYNSEPCWEIAPKKLPRTVSELLGQGWRVEADGKTFRSPGAFKVEVSSGIDWFELHGTVSYGDTSASLPDLLKALKRGERMVRLGDGSYGMLPEEWLSRFGAIAGLGTSQEDHVRFQRAQAGLLDALLAAQPEAAFDETFARVRDELHRFEGVAAAEQPATFEGKLRDYQREGLGWLHFLRRFSFGGCLADDMGVGKTAQVLALLESRRELREAGDPLPPSLVVVPRSLVFNWKEEAARFTPKMRVLDHTGQQRDMAGFSSYDLIVTTYGTVRSDILKLRDVEFDYVVLDEAQAVKNASTDASKAVRLLKGRHRVAMSGTPIENHLGELWTLFDFLNPGMLGSASVFKLTGASARTISEDTRALLGQALRPFILRRTKEQVARELPPKTEQTIYCELTPGQRKLYDELRRHYRDSLLKRIDSAGMGKAKIQVLEALLRLRQAACHPGLVDNKRAKESSAKLDTLLEQLDEVIDGGHKALVFSQFTSLLALVRERLDAAGIIYEYLDGQTVNRQACVERFQTDNACPVFLISLKAGGLGLNLTAAEYVFLLDPWWNPAVEAQAVDRAHRIGQTKQVSAYRLIARDTVEEKVLELQKNKRDLAAAIIGEDNSLISGLKREDLELLLS